MTKKPKLPDLPTKFTVGIAEKPSAAKKIAQALDDKGKPFSGTNTWKHHWNMNGGLER